MLCCSAQPLKPGGDFVRKSLHKGIRAIGKYLMCEGFILVTQRLVLCNPGTLGKGTLRMYPSLSVPAYPFRVLGLSARSKYLGESSVCKYHGRLQCDATQHGVYSGN